jgi:hypothetical protein
MQHFRTRNADTFDGLLEVTPSWYVAEGSMASVKRGEKITLRYQDGTEEIVSCDGDSILHERGARSGSSEGETIGEAIERVGKGMPEEIHIKRVGINFSTDPNHHSWGSEEETFQPKKHA